MATVVNPTETETGSWTMPKELAILPLRGNVAFPFAVLPLSVGIPRSVRLVEEALQHQSLVGLVAMKDASVSEPRPGEVFETGTVARIVRVMRTADAAMQVVVQGLGRFRVTRWLGEEPYLRARVESAPDRVQSDIQTEALLRSLRELGHEVVELSPNIPKEAAGLLESIEDPRQLTYLVAANAQLELAEAERILEMDSIEEKLQALIVHLSHEGASAPNAALSGRERARPACRHSPGRRFQIHEEKVG